MNRCIFFIIVYNLFPLNLISQKSNLGRFEINVTQGCSPLKIEIVSEDVDSSATVIQYDFNYDINNPSFNPSVSSKNSYTTPGKYTIAQAINVDNTEKIDVIEVEVFESKKIDLIINNCLNNKLELIISDDYYDGFNLYVDNRFVKELNSGKNDLEYGVFLDSENKFNGIIKGKFNDNDESCYDVSFSVSSINLNSKPFIDSVVVSDDRTSFSLFYKPEKSTNYTLYVDGNIDSTYFSPSYIYFNDSEIKIFNKTFSDKYVSIEKNYLCQNEKIEDKIYLLYMNTYEVEEGVRIDLNYDNDFDSVNIYKNQKIFSSSKENNVDNYNLIKGEEYCYRAVGYKEGKKSISNTNCIIIKENHNPLPIANTFSPNGDGLNDEFKPFPRSVKDYNLLIYDMSGVKVFESQDINIGWNGYYDGKITQGSYIYILNFVFDGKDVNQRGKFLLIK
mgnify:FL=1|tara:strand:- start:4111 stop:5451 length:1341 start_codon:yes stop_codon:yes gene_type:complete